MYDAGDDSDDRGQLSLPAVEAAVGVTFVLGVAVTFGLALPDAGTAEIQLDTYARDAGTVLSGEPPRHGGSSRLAEVARSPASLARERAALERRVDRILGDNLMYRVVTPHGAVGDPRPRDVPLGRAAVPTRNGEVTLWVWFV